jgi:nuclear pore complex protein Nup188
MATWLQDDGLAAKAALQATGSVTHTIAAEERPGEIMAAVQVERLWILATLLETAFDAAAAPDDAAVGELAIEMRKIIDSPILAAVDAARDPLLPPIHRPLLRISRLLLKQVAMMPRRSNQVHAFIEMAGEFILDASCAAFDAMSRDAHLESDLVLAVEPLIELINTGTSTWLDQFAESGLILRSLILIKRIPKGTHVPTYIPSILLFHLALANHPQAAEKLAVSGIIPAYSDNAVTIAAEEGDIKPDSDVLSVHSAWCGMLLVVQSLLTTLPEPANFARDQVASFVRLANQQIHAAFERFEQDEKNGSAQSTALFRASLDELRLTVEVLFGMARAAPGNVRVFADYQTALVHLLTNVTRALNHPRRFADSIVPTSVEEHGQLAKELEILDKQPEGATVLVKMAETPFLGSQVMVVLQIAQMALRALIGMTNTWAVLRGQREPKAELVLEADVSSHLTLFIPVPVLIMIRTSSCPPAWIQSARSTTSNPPSLPSHLASLAPAPTPHPRSCCRHATTSPRPLPSSPPRRSSYGAPCCSAGPDRHSRMAVAMRGMMIVKTTMGA